MTNFACQFYESRDKPFWMGSSLGCLGNDNGVLGMAQCYWTANVCVLLRYPVYQNYISSWDNDDDDYDKKVTEFT